MIELLLQKLREGSLSPAERGQLKQLLSEQDEGGQLHEFLAEDWAKLTENDLPAAPDHLRELVLSSATQKLYIRRRYRSAMAMAASLLLLLSTLWWILQPKDSETEWLVSEANMTERQIELPDGSLVSLSPGSILHYKDGLDKAPIRRVQLTGNATFTVQHDPAHPFHVEAGGLRTEVLGTIFHVEASQGADTVIVALREGKVNVSLLERSTDIDTVWQLEPSERLVYLPEAGIVSLDHFDLDQLAQQNESATVFDGADLELVLEALSTAYGVQFEVLDRDQIHSKVIYRLNPNRYSISETLGHLSRISDYTFETLSDTRYRVRPK